MKLETFLQAMSSSFEDEVKFIIKKERRERQEEYQMGEEDTKDE